MSIQLTVFKGLPNGGITKTITSHPALKRNEVLLRNTHSGVCSTDLHMMKNSIGQGHEGVSVVEAVGPDVLNLKM